MKMATMAHGELLFAPLQDYNHLHKLRGKIARRTN